MKQCSSCDIVVGDDYVVEVAGALRCCWCLIHEYLELLKLKEKCPHNTVEADIASAAWCKDCGAVQFRHSHRWFLPGRDRHCRKRDCLCGDPDAHRSSK